MTNLEVPVAMVWIGFAIVALITTISSIVLDYHWRHYGMNSKNVAHGRILYFIGLASLLGGALIIAIIIT